jgi:hypothetical protein
MIVLSLRSFDGHGRRCFYLNDGDGVRLNLVREYAGAIEIVGI